jgi:predicted acylesterase/phospholipase RssA
MVKDKYKEMIYKEDNLKDIKKIGLSLSGGGFRATLFHIGVLRYLYHAKILDRVILMCSVSGGSIIAAHFALNRDEYLKDFDNAVKNLIDFIRNRDLRNRIIRRWFPWCWLELPSLWEEKYSSVKSRKNIRGDLLENEYEILFKKNTLNNLSNEQMNLHIITTSLTNVNICSFTKNQFWDNITEKESECKIHGIHDNVSVAFAVAASSAFPPLFPPVMLSAKKLNTKSNNFLGDGGIMDNYGVEIKNIAKILKIHDNIDMYIISDASSHPNQKRNVHFKNIIHREFRINEMLMNRITNLTKKIHEWKICAINETLDPQKCVIAFSKNPKKNRAIQRILARVRTDLNSFTDSEINGLITHGVNIAYYNLNKYFRSSTYGNQ